MCVEDVTVTFVFDHKPFVEWQVHSVHTKLPGLCAFWSARARIVPDQVCSYQCAAWLMHKNYLHAVVECPCMLAVSICHFQTSFYLSCIYETNAGAVSDRRFAVLLHMHPAGMQQDGLLSQHMTTQLCTQLMSATAFGQYQRCYKQFPKDKHTWSEYVSRAMASLSRFRH